MSTLPLVVGIACFIGMFIALAVLVMVIENMERENEAD
jgi:hypothetical protein